MLRYTNESKKDWEASASIERGKKKERGKKQKTYKKVCGIKTHQREAHCKKLPNLFVLACTSEARKFSHLTHGEWAWKMYYKKSVSEDVSGKISNSNHNKSGGRIFFFLTQKLWKNSNMKLITTKFSLNHSLSDSPFS